MPAPRKVRVRVLGQHGILERADVDAPQQWDTAGATRLQLAAFRFLAALCMTCPGDDGLPAKFAPQSVGSDRKQFATLAGIELEDLEEGAGRFTETLRRSLDDLFVGHLGSSKPLRRVTGKWTVDQSAVALELDIDVTITKCRPGLPVKDRAAALDEAIAKLDTAFASADLELQRHLRCAPVEDCIHKTMRWLLEQRVAVAERLQDGPRARELAVRLAQMYPADISGETVRAAVSSQRDRDRESAHATFDAIRLALDVRPVDHRLTAARLHLDRGTLEPSVAAPAADAMQLRTAGICCVSDFTHEHATVHRALEEHCTDAPDGECAPRQPPFIRRQALVNELSARVMAALSTAGPHVIVIEGDSTAGKSRTALHVLRECCSEAFIIAPRDAHSAVLTHDPAAHPMISALPNAAVVLWLDNAEEFIGVSEDSLGCGHLQALERHQRSIIILCTVGGRSSRRTDQDRRRHDELERFLAHGAPFIECPRRITDPHELAEVEQRFGRAVRAVAHSDGLGAALVARDQVIRRYRSGSPPPAEGGGEGRTFAEGLLRWRATAAPHAVSEDRAKRLWKNGRARHGERSQPTDKRWDEAKKWASYADVPGHPVVAWSDRPEGWDVSELLPLDDPQLVRDALELDQPELQDWAGANADRLATVAARVLEVGAAELGSETASRLDAWLTRAHELAPGERDLLWLHGWLCEFRGQRARARSFYGDACERDPQSFALALMHATLLADTDRDAAATGCLRALKLDSIHPSQLAALALLMHTLEMDDATIFGVYERALALDPVHPRAVEGAARHLHAADEFPDRAAALLDEALDRAGDGDGDAELRFRAALVFELFDEARARECYAAAWATAPDRVEIVQAWATFEGATGELDKAETLFTRAEARFPCNSKLLAMYAEFRELRRGDHDGAEGLYQRAAEATPVDPDALDAYADFLDTVRGDAKGAADMYEAALLARPWHPGYAASYAWLMERTGSDDAERIATLYGVALRGGDAEASALVRDFAARHADRPAFVTRFLRRLPAEVP